MANRGRPRKDTTSAVQSVDDAAEAQAAAVAESEERMGASRPTPTQRENDLAKIGALDIDEKEDDGSGPDPHNQPLPHPRDAGFKPASNKD